MVKTADIIIIGGGIIGATIAYQLALRGTTNVLVLERDALASGSSGRATGGLRHQFADELDIRFSIEGIRFYEQFTKEGGSSAPREYQPPRFYQYGYLFLLSTPESWQAMQRHVALQQSLGVPTRLINPAEAQQRVPQLVIDDLLGASFCPTDGYSDPGTMARALAHEAKARGVTFRESSPVIGIKVEHQRVQAVQTPQDTIATPLVINATGAYATFVARLAGLPDLPVRPLRRQVYCTEPFANLPQDVPMTVDLSSGFHFRRSGESVLMIMPMPPSPEEEAHNQALTPSAFDLHVDELQWPLVQAAARRRCPVLTDAPIAQVWSGLYEMTPDEHPILGKTEIDGFLCACGFSGHGFMHAPMAAKLMTELILDGSSTTLAIEQFSVERFHKGRLLETTRLL